MGQWSLSSTRIEVVTAELLVDVFPPHNGREATTGGATRGYNWRCCTGRQRTTLRGRRQNLLWWTAMVSSGMGSTRWRGVGDELRGRSGRRRSRCSRSGTGGHRAEKSPIGQLASPAAGGRK
jgi:hypothetical protein